MMSGPWQEEDYLPLSGIQHFVFCPRQWALIHLDQQWEENHLTTEGSILHERVDDPFQRERNGTAVVTLRGFRLSSPNLGVSGIADAVELHPDDGMQHPAKTLIANKNCTVLPIEYKRGRRKISDCDRAQVAAQAIILEEMLGIPISRGAVFHWEERRREYFDISQEMRNLVKETCRKMHEAYETRELPCAILRKGCRSCSLYDICMPKVGRKDVRKYISDHIDTDIE